MEHGGQLLCPGGRRGVNQRRIERRGDGMPAVSLEAPCHWSATTAYWPSALRRGRRAGGRLDGHQRLVLDAGRLLAGRLSRRRQRRLVLAYRLKLVARRRQGRLIAAGGPDSVARRRRGRLVLLPGLSRRGKRRRAGRRLRRGLAIGPPGPPGRPFLATAGSLAGCTGPISMATSAWGLVAGASYGQTGIRRCCDCSRIRCASSPAAAAITLGYTP